MRAVLALGTGARPRDVGAVVGVSERISGLLVLSAVASRFGASGRRDWDGVDDDDGGAGVSVGMVFFI